MTSHSCFCAAWGSIDERHATETSIEQIATEEKCRETYERWIKSFPVNSNTYVHAVHSLSHLRFIMQ